MGPKEEVQKRCEMSVRQMRPFRLAKELPLRVSHCSYLSKDEDHDLFSVQLLAVLIVRYLAIRICMIISRFALGESVVSTRGRLLER